MTSYFSDLFTAKNTDWDLVTDCIQKTITDEQNLMLVAEVSDVEVKNTLFYMYPNKSPGPDGMSP